MVAQRLDAGATDHELNVSYVGAVGRGGGGLPGDIALYQRGWRLVLVADDAAHVGAAQRA